MTKNEKISRSLKRYHWKKRRNNFIAAVILYIVLPVAGLNAASIAYEPYTTVYEVEQPPLEIIEITHNTTPEMYRKIDFYAQKHGADAELMKEVIDCETARTWDSEIKSQYPGEESYGLAQIHLPDHPQVTKEQATDPDYALDFMARHFAQGNHEWWTCYRLIQEGRI